MSDEFGQLLSEQKEVAISQGAVVSGQVIAVKEDEIVLNIGYKADAVISRNEFTNIPNANLCDLVKVGDEIEAKVVKMNDGEGQVQLSVRKLQAERGSKVLEDAFENKTVLKAVVTEISTGGLSVVVDQTRVLSRQALYPMYTRRILRSTRDRKLSLSLLSSTRRSTELSVTARS